jgi:predicted HicB family RNase H-like nuclease
VQGDYRACQAEFRKYNIRMENKPGRPPRDRAEGASKIVPIRMTEAERQRYQQAAERAGVSLSEWARDRLDKAAKRESKRD